MEFHFKQLGFCMAHKFKNLRTFIEKRTKIYFKEKKWL